MRKRKMDATPLAEFPQLGLLLDSTVSDGKEIRDRIQAVLERLEEDEREAKVAIEAAGGVPDRPFAATAKVLLGLTPRSAHKKIGARRNLAASVRKIAPRTMRTHEKLIARQLAAVLLAEAAAHPRAMHLRELVLPYASLATLPYEEWSALLDILPRDELRRLTRELALGYKDFADGAAGKLSIDWAGFELQPLGERGFRDYLARMPPLPGLPRHLRERFRPEVSLRSRFFHRVLRAEKTGESRYALIVSILELLDGLLPSFSQQEREHLEALAREAGGQEHVFLKQLEETALGRDLLRKWFKMNSILGDVGPEGVTRHVAIHNGFKYIWQLLWPDPENRLDRKALNRYLSTQGWTDPLIPYQERLRWEMEYSNYVLMWVHKMGGLRRAARCERANHQRMMER